MTEPPVPPAARKGGLFKNLSPKQKRLLAVVGVGGLLALIYLMMRSRQAPAEEEGRQSGAEEGQAAFGVPSGAGGATDPTAFLGAQSEALGGRLEEVSQGLGEVAAGQGELARGEEELGQGYMQGHEEDSQEFGRIGAALSQNNRQLGAIRKQLAHKGSKGKGRGNAKHHGKQHRRAHKAKAKPHHKKRHHRAPKQHHKPRRHRRGRR